MSPKEIKEEYDFKVPENFTAPEVEIIEQDITAYFNLTTELECEGLFLSDNNITDLMHSNSSNVSDIFINKTER